MLSSPDASRPPRHSGLRVHPAADDLRRTHLCWPMPAQIQPDQRPLAAAEPDALEDAAPRQGREDPAAVLRADKDGAVGHLTHR